jgi:hypothetical protein
MVASTNQSYKKKRTLYKSTYILKILHLRCNNIFGKFSNFGENFRKIAVNSLPIRT